MPAPKLPKYEWHVLTPDNHAANQLPRRHAVVSGAVNGSVHALCGGKPDKDAYKVSGAKTLEAHPICGRCLAQIDRSLLMIGAYPGGVPDASLLARVVETLPPPPRKRTRKKIST